MRLTRILCLCSLVVLADACGGWCLLVEVDLPSDSVVNQAIELSLTTAASDSVVSADRRK
jgi:hypothetical protein